MYKSGRNESPSTREIGMSKQEKLETLVEIEGYADEVELMEAATFDSVAPGICLNDGCDYTTQVEPDCRDGYCEVCGTQTVVSGLELAFEII